jgi:putative endonuclease
MPDPRQQLGKQGESIAIQYLVKNGYRIIETNYRTDFGEIDIIAKDKGTLVFIEVKTRKSYRFGDPKYAITQKKQRKISMVALGYLKVTRQERAKARFDVVAISPEEDHHSIEIVRNAFDLAYGS